MSVRSKKLTGSDSDIQVSVIIPLFNKALYIHDTVSTVIRQSLDNWELLVVDNGSTDAGPQHVAALARQDQRIRLLSCRRKGPGAARNVGISSATGKWCLLFDADDLMDGDYLSALLDAAAMNPQSTILAAGWYEFNDGEPSAMARRCNPTERHIRFSSIAYTPWPISAALVRREALAGNFLWSEALDHAVAEDTAFWFRLLQYYSPTITTVAGFRYRIATANSRNDKSRLTQWLSDIRCIHTDNVSFLARHQLPLDYRHAEYLMRTYVSLWAEADSKAEHDVASDALAIARRWLSKSVALGGWRQPTLLLRSILGIPRFHRLVSLIRR